MTSSRGRFLAACVLVLTCQPVAGPLALEEAPAPLNEALIDQWSAPLVDTIAAEAWILVEAVSGQVIAAHAADDKRAVASTIKVLTALSVVKRASTSDLVAVGDEVLGVGGAGAGLRPGDIWTVAELLDALISRSGNDAAEALAVHVGGTRDEFLEMMRADAAEIGVERSLLTSPSGLDDGNRLSSRDLAVIARSALAEPVLRPFLARRVVDLPNGSAIESRNELLYTYHGATGVKTGFTLMAGNALIGSALRNGRELIAVVLGAGDDPARFDATAQLLDYGFDRTAVTSAPQSVGLSRGGGVTHFTHGQAWITAPVSHHPEFVVDWPARAVDELVRMHVHIDGHVYGQLIMMQASDVDDVDNEGERVGRAVVDGVYAGLRSASMSGALR